MIRELLAFIAPSFVPNELKPLEVTEKLSFSDAILRGCMVTRESAAVYLTGRGACVMGAAIVGAGWKERSWDPMREAGRKFYEINFGPLGTQHELYYARYGDSFERHLSHGISRETIAARFKALGS